MPRATRASPAFISASCCSLSQSAALDIEWHGARGVQHSWTACKQTAQQQHAKQSVLMCRGECLLGFCRCEPGFFGLDCGLSVDVNTGQPYVWVTNPLTASDGLQAPPHVLPSRCTCQVSFEPGQQSVHLAASGAQSVPRGRHEAGAILLVPTHSLPIRGTDEEHVQLVERHTALLESVRTGSVKTMI